MPFIHRIEFLVRAVHSAKLAHQRHYQTFPLEKVIELEDDLVLAGTLIRVAVVHPCTFVSNVYVRFPQ